MLIATALGFPRCERGTVSAFSLGMTIIRMEQQKCYGSP